MAAFVIREREADLVESERARLPPVETERENRKRTSCETG